VTAAAGLLLTRLNVPNAFVLGALVVTIPLSIAGVTASAMPRVLLNGAQLLLGCALGSRFNRSFLARTPRLVDGCGNVNAGADGREARAAQWPDRFDVVVVYRPLPTPVHT
jgi:Transition state regulatory protein AbrB